MDSFSEIRAYNTEKLSIKIILNSLYKTAYIDFKFKGGILARRLRNLKDGEQNQHAWDDLKKYGN